MSTIIDRRLNGKGKSTVNRGRFLERYKDRIKDAIQEQIKGKSIKDIGKTGTDVIIPKKDINEPYFGHSGDGVWDSVNTGNDSYNKGDKIHRPDNSDGSGGKASNSDELSEDDFQFALTKEEFIKYLFEGLELPNLIKKKLMEIPNFKNKRAGYKTSGSASSMSVVRTMRGSLGRRIALGGKTKKQIEDLEEELGRLDICEDAIRIEAISSELVILYQKLSRIPFIDPIDLRFANTIQVPQPTTVAVVFMIMDVSGSMGEEEKNIAKQFFLLLYLFLTRSYEKIELVFIRHHTTAHECTEEEFFHDRESGGTVVSSALDLTANIIHDRYSGDEYNIYVSQASDGDNWGDDNRLCAEILKNKILPFIQYMAYIEIDEQGNTQDLWNVYKKLAYENDHFEIRPVSDVTEVYPVFRGLFEAGEK